MGRSRDRQAVETSALGGGFRSRLAGVLMAGLAVASVAVVSTCKSDPVTQVGAAAATTAATRGSALDGRVIAIADGDTMTILVEGDRLISVRLADIDAPERGQPWGNRSRQSLSELVFQRQVNVEQSGQDRWGRTVARVFVGRRDVSRELVAEGAAWAYRAYLTDETLIEVEAVARSSRRGLWSLPVAERIAPWAWRRGERPATQGQDEQRGPPTPSLLRSREAEPAVRCGSKTICRQMTSCLEARAYLSQCRGSGLDADGDGHPCETLCTIGER